MDKKEKKTGKWGLIKRFLPYYKKYKWILVADLFCASLTTVCELVLPLIVRAPQIVFELIPTVFTSTPARLKRSRGQSATPFRQSFIHSLQI